MPTYTPLERSRWACSDCACEVTDPARHTGFHVQLRTQFNTDVTWVNHVTSAEPRNGTATVSCNPAAPSNAVAGVAFTPTNLNTLVVFVYAPIPTFYIDGGVTWDAAAGGLSFASGNGQLLVATRSAAGAGDTMTIILPEADLPVLFDWYEFDGPHTVTSAFAGAGIDPNGSIVGTSSLHGNNTVISTFGITVGSSVTETVTWDVGDSTVGDYGVSIPDDGVASGYLYGATALSGTAQNFPFAATSSYRFGPGCERLTVAVEL